MKKSTKRKIVGGLILAALMAALYVVPSIWQAVLIYQRFEVVADSFWIPHWSLYLYIPAVVLSVLLALMRTLRK